MGQEHDDSDLEFDSDVFWEPVKLQDCWSNEVLRMTTEDEPCGGILDLLHWSDS